MADVELTLKLEGFAEFARALRQLPKHISADIIESALFAGGHVIRNAAVGKAPHPEKRRRPKTVRLADSIRFFPREKDAAHAIVDVGTRVRYAHLVEYGHQIVPRGPTRQRVSITQVSKTGRVSTRLGVDPSVRTDRRTRAPQGFVAPRPFLRPAFDENRERVIRRVGQVLGQEIERAFRRMAPKAKVA